jgi:hypothetical protein
MSIKKDDDILYILKKFFNDSDYNIEKNDNVLYILMIIISIFIFLGFMFLHDKFAQKSMHIIVACPSESFKLKYDTKTNVEIMSLIIDNIEKDNSICKYDSIEQFLDINHYKFNEQEHYEETQ